MLQLKDRRVVDVELDHQMKVEEPVVSDDPIQESKKMYEVAEAADSQIYLSNKSESRLFVKLNEVKNILKPDEATYLKGPVDEEMYTLSIYASVNGEVRPVMMRMVRPSSRYIESIAVYQDEDGKLTVNSERKYSGEGKRL